MFGLLLLIDQKSESVSWNSDRFVFQGDIAGNGIHADEPIAGDGDLCLLDIPVALGEKNSQFVAEPEGVRLNFRIAQRMEFFGTETSVIKKIGGPFPEGVGFAKIGLITGGGCDGTAAAVDFHVAPAAEKKHLVDGKFDVGIIADIAVGDDRFGECFLEEIVRRTNLRFFSGLSPVRIPGRSGEAEDVDKIRILQSLVGRAFNSETKIAFSGFCVFVELLEHFPFTVHESGEWDGMSVRGIAAGIGGKSKLIEKDGIGSDFDCKINMPFENFDPGTAGGTGNDEGFVAEGTQESTGVAEIVEFAVLGAVRAFDGDALSFSGAIVVRVCVDELSIEIENDFPPSVMDFADVFFECFDSAL